MLFSSGAIRFLGQWIIQDAGLVNFGCPTNLEFLQLAYWLHEGGGKT